MQPTTNTQSPFNPITVIVPNGAIKGPTDDGNADKATFQCHIRTVLALFVEAKYINKMPR
ncbi:1891_t:CDS:2 [Ambispora gerdemannii]|uniref:1891_t:CDS:1 n=1 Tax=Ambispora gerdemannii TaxID=144530 RepID=A0A9N8Z3D5_9GLOM|nr:1891_t:CDS:2 [Ambispora gerdemannii]